MIWFNEHDRFCVQWLKARFPTATIDERSVKDVTATDVVGRRCHFFGGIGGWELALQLAGWPDDREVWTGSCPCQPFSAAGKRKGTADERHLWPDWFELIAERHPECIFGEQVASAIGHGWLDRVFADLESEGYTCGAVVLGAHSVGAPHIRQRLWWVAYASGERRQQESRGALGDEETDGREGRDGIEPDRNNIVAGHGEECGGLGDTDEQGSQGRRINSGERPDQSSPWAASELIQCRDGKARRIEPGIRPLAHGIPGRVGRLRGYGNAIVPQVAAEFIQAFIEVTP